MASPETARYLDRGSAPHITTLVMATASYALAINIFLPSLPGMARHFSAEYGQVQLAISLFLVGNAVLQLIVGPLSDRFGRRPVMIGCMVIFLGGTAMAMVAPTIELLLAARMLQAFSAGAVVLSRAIIRDTVSADRAASRMGYVMMGMSLVPMLGPILGGYLDEWYGWRSTFVLTFAFGCVALALVILDMGETNRDRAPSLAAQMRTYPELLASPRFWLYALTAALSSGAFYAFLGGGPLVASEMLGLTPSGYGLYFAFVSAGYLTGNFLSGRFAETVGVNRMMLAGNLIGVAGVTVSLVLFAAGVIHPLSLFGPTFILGLGNGITLPSASAGIVSVRPQLAGSASGLGGALQIGGGALLSVVAAGLLSAESGAAPLLWVMFGSCAGGALATVGLMALNKPLEQS